MISSGADSSCSSRTTGYILPITTKYSDRNLDQRTRISKCTSSLSMDKSCAVCLKQQVSDTHSDMVLSSDDVISTSTTRDDPGNHERGLHKQKHCSILSDRLSAASETIKSKKVYPENTPHDVSTKMINFCERLPPVEETSHHSSSEIPPGHGLKSMDNKGDTTATTDIDTIDTSICGVTEEDFTSPISHIARQLAMIGDDVNERYRSEFNRIRYDVTITTTAGLHGNLTSIVYRSFYDRIWNHVLCGTLGAVFKLMTSDHIMNWIVDQTRLTTAPEYLDTVAWSTIALVCTGTALSLVSIVVLNRYSG